MASSRIRAIIPSQAGFLEVDLRGCFSNPRKPLRTLISHVIKGSQARRPRVQRARIADERGPVAENSLRPQTRLSASNRAELLTGYAAGVPVRELAARFEVHRGTVWDVARRAGLEPRRPELSEATRAEAARLYGEGLTLAGVAAQLGISDDTVRAAVIACGGTIRPAGRRRVHA